MKSIKKLATILVLLIFVLACSKDDPRNPDDLEITYNTVDVKIELPAGSTINLSDTELSTLFLDTPVNSDGTVAVPFNSESPEIAFLMDKDNNILLSGFIKGNDDKISVESTAEVLLYFSLGTTFLPYAAKEKFINEVNTLNGFSEFNKKLKELAVQDNLFIEKASYGNILGEYLKSIKKTDTIDIRTGKIDVNVKDIRSGLQLIDIDFQNITITNTNRRRAHAFIYKTSCTTEGGVETPNNSNEPISEVAISPVSGVRGFVSTVDTWGQGKAMDFIETVSEPIKLPLEEGFDECTYNVCVIGPASFNAFDGGPKLTGKEADKLLKLTAEMFALDILLPAILDLNGHKKLLSKKLPQDKLDAIADITSAALNTIPGAVDNLKSGNFEKLLQDFLFTMYTEWSSSQMQNFLEPIVTLVGAVADETVTGGYFSQNIENIANKIKKFNKFIEYLDNTLKVADYARVAYSLSATNEKECWTVKSKKSDIILTPEEQVTVPGKFVDVEVLKEPTPNEGAVLQYEWLTTGKYGNIQDNSTHQGTSFTSTIDKVSYVSNVPESQLSDGDNIDVISVIVYIKKGQETTKIGSAQAIVNVKKFKYEIKPNGVIINGGTSLVMDIVRSDGERLTDNNVYESKVIWSTSPGSYGKFYGTNKQVTLEKKSDYSINFEAFYKEVPRVAENITALIYRKQKTDSEYTLWEEAKATIYIENDPKVKRFVLPIVIKEFTTPILNNPSCPSSLEIDAGVLVPKFEGDVTYNVTFEKLIFGWNNSTVAPVTRAWTNTNFQPYYIYDRDGNNFFVWQAGAGMCSTSTTISQTRGRYATAKGSAQVTITFK